MFDFSKYNPFSKGKANSEKPVVDNLPTTEPKIEESTTSQSMKIPIYIISIAQITEDRSHEIEELERTLTIMQGLINQEKNEKEEAIQARQVLADQIERLFAALTEKVF